MYYLFILLFIYSLIILQNQNKAVKITIQIKNDWKDKRQFNYLNYIKNKNNFLMKTNSTKRTEKLKKFRNKTINKFKKYRECLKIKEENNRFLVETMGRRKPEVYLYGRIAVEIVKNPTIINELLDIENQVIFEIF